MARATHAGRGSLVLRSTARSLAFLLAPLLVLVSVWLPLVEHYRSPQAELTASAVEAARRSPEDGLLEELRRFFIVPFPGRTAAFEVSAAEAILEGRLELPTLPAGRLQTPPSPDDLGRLPAGLQLSYAGLVVPDLLLAAYASTGREEFFQAARAFMVSWDRHERGSWGPEGLLWNDHAIAARVRVLAEFWRIYRARPDYDAEIGRAVLAQAARYGHFLASPEQFTFATNHGIIQNLGLLLLSLAFPSLPDRDRYHDVALERLAGQLEYLVDDDGVIRENSAGYQAFDLAMLGMTYRAMTLLGDPIPQTWAQRYASALEFLARLRRPDGTLPLVGDTDAGAYGEFPPTSVIDAAGRAASLEPYAARRPEASETLAAAAGYWIDWDWLERWPDGRDLTQTVLAWTSPPGTGHEHADEPSLQVWADGVAWFTGTGYWPYDDDGRREAESWPGANAPHLAGEAWASSRQARPLWLGRVEGIAVVDVGRTGPGAYDVRRQVVHLEPDLWIVLDVITGGDAATQTVWTFSPSIELQPAEAAGTYRLVAGSVSASARLDYVGSPATATTGYRGSREPFAGWQVVDGTPLAAPAVLVEQPPGSSWLAAVLSREDGSTDGHQVTGRPIEARVDAPEHWRLVLPTDGGRLVVERAGSTLDVTRLDADDAPVTVELVPAPDVDPERARLRAAFEAMAAAYPQFQPQTSRRANVSILIVLFGLGQEAFLVVVRRWRPRLYRPLRVLGTLAWVAVAAWLGFLFIRSWQILALPA